jgi:Meckel syndrome type 1 protein
MRRALAHALLVAGLALVAPAFAQFGVPSPAVQADAHIFSAFLTRSDPHVLADKLRLGPKLKAQLGPDPGPGKVYEALLAAMDGKELRSRSLSAKEAAGYASLGLNSVDPVVLVEAGTLRLVMQYSTAGKHVAFVEQVGGTSLTAPAPAPEAKPRAEAPKPEPAAKSTPTPAVVAAPAAPKAAATAKPRGECVVKPVMSEDDLWNCSAPGQASNALVSTPAPAPAPVPAAAETSALVLQPPAAQPTPRECVIKPVMTEEELRVCAAERRSQPVTPKEISAPAIAPSASPVASVQAPPPVAQHECVIKPVMSEEDLRACAKAAPSMPMTAVEVQSAAEAAPPAPAASSAPRECVVKPVMTEDDLRACARR